MHVIRYNLSARLETYSSLYPLTGLGSRIRDSNFHTASLLLTAKASCGVSQLSICATATATATPMGVRQQQNKKTLTAPHRLICARGEALLGINIIMNMSMGISSMDISTICNKQQVERNKCVAAPSSVAAATSRWSEHGAVVGARVYYYLC